MNVDFMRMFLSPEMNAGIDLASGEDPEAVFGQYAIGQGIKGVSSVPSSDVTAATDQFAEAGLKSPGRDALGNTTTDQLYKDAVNIPTTQAYPEALTIKNTGLQDTGIGGQTGQIKLDNDALNSTIPQQGIDITNSQPTGMQYNDNAYQSIDTPVGGLPNYNPQGLPDEFLANQDNIGLGDITEKEATFLGLEGKDYTKMGMQGVLAAGVGAMKPTPVQPSKAPVGQGMTRGNPIQTQAPGVNSMVQPDPRLNSMQMTQAQGLISPFQRDRYRRGQY